MKKRVKASSYTVPQSKDLPATQGMLYLVRTELKEDMAELRSEMNMRFSQGDVNFQKVLTAVHQVSSEVARLGLLVEEQNSRNQIVLEGLTGLHQRQDRAEARMDGFEKTLKSLSRSN